MIKVIKFLILKLQFKYKKKEYYEQNELKKKKWNKKYLFYKKIFDSLGKSKKIKNKTIIETKTGDYRFNNFKLDKEEKKIVNYVFKVEVITFYIFDIIAFLLNDMDIIYSVFVTSIFMPLGITLMMYLAVLITNIFD